MSQALKNICEMHCESLNSFMKKKNEFKDSLLSKSASTDS